MSRFRIIYSPKSERDLQDSFDWGVEVWGREAAVQWLRKISMLIDKQLSSMPHAYGLAPESRKYDFELRQMQIRRYRVLFRIQDDTVYILRVRGPFSGQALEVDKS